MQIGFSELIVIVIVAMIFISPDKLSKAAYNIGKLLCKINENKSEIVEGLHTVTKEVSEVTQPIRDVVQPITDLKEELQSSIKVTK